MAQARPTLDETYMSLVDKLARRGTCARRKVGCVLTTERGEVIGTGWNGVPQKFPHCNEGTTSQQNIFCSGQNAESGVHLSGCIAVHAEANALAQCRRTSELHTCYTSASPCVSCIGLLLNTPCQRIVFFEEYPHPVSRDMWLWKKREWLQWR